MRIRWINSWRHCRLRRLPALWLQGVLISLGVQALSTARTTIIAHRTDAAIGTEEFSGFGGPVLNSASQVAFAASFATSSADADTALFRGTEESLTMFAREGSPVSGFQRVYNDFRDGATRTELAMNDAGRVAFWARSTSMTDPSDDNVEHIMWWDEGALVRTVAFTGLSVPDGNGGYASFGPRVGVANFGGVYFRAAIDVADPSVSGGQGIFLTDGAVPTQTYRVVRAGDEENNGNGPIDMCGVLASCGMNFGYNDNGDIATYAFTASPTHRSLIVRSFVGALPFAVGLESGIWDYSGLYMEGLGFDPSVNNDYEVAFSTGVGDGSLLTSSSIILRKRNDASLFAIKVAMTDDPAPDGNGALGQVSQPIINDASQVAFASTFRETADPPDDDSGLLLSTSDVPAIVAREGDAATGGGLYSDFGDPVFALNQSGLVAFQADLHGLLLEQRAIFLSDTDETREVVHTGSPMLGSTITDVEFVGDSARDRTGLNDLGQVAYRAVLENGLEAIAVYTPDVRWRSGVTGNWDAPDNWQLGIKPASVHDVTVDSQSQVVVTGPAASSAVRSLTVGPGPVELTLSADSQLHCGAQFEMSGAAELVLEIGESSTAASGRIAVAGDAVLSGSFRMIATAGFVPSPAQTFEIVSTEDGVIAGQLGPEPASFPFVVHYDPSFMSVVVLPRAGDSSTIGAFVNCLGGAMTSPDPDQPFTSFGCVTAFDSDDDGDVDLRDAAGLQNLFTAN